jgi:hypothetical protein
MPTIFLGYHVITCYSGVLENFRIVNTHTKKARARETSGFGWVSGDFIALVSVVLSLAPDWLATELFRVRI